jgi:hypothetical protein
MANIQSITLRYSEIEDRLQLDCLSSQQETFKIWLTKRFADRLVAVLAEKISERLSLQGHEATRAHKIQQELTKFTLSQNGRKAVSLQSESPSWLCNTLKIGMTESSLILSFLGTNNETATLNLQQSETRSLLEIVRKNYIAAKWALDVFPNWMGDAPPKDDTYFMN